MALSHNTSVVTNGLILCLDSANVKSYPKTGTTWTDTSGNGNTGTLTNAPTYSSANSGSIVFDGVDDYVTVADNTGLRFDASQPFTLSVWIKPAVLLSAWTGIVTKSRDASPWYGIWIDPSNRITWGYPTVSVYGPTATTEWQNIVISKDSTSRYIFVNGQLKTSLSGAANVSGNGAMYVGRGGTIGEYFNGSITDVKLYNRYLSPEEVLQNFNALRGRFGL